MKRGVPYVEAALVALALLLSKPLHAVPVCLADGAAMDRPPHAFCQQDAGGPLARPPHAFCQQDAGGPLGRTPGMSSAPPRRAATDPPAQRPEAPDLIVTQIAWTPGSPVVGDTVHFTVYVRNQGDVDTSTWANVGVRFFVDGSSIGDDHAANIAPGATESFDFYWIATSGSHALRAVADYGDYIPESDEFNNEGHASLDVSNPSAPDLIVTQIAWTPGSPVVGDSVHLTVYVRNQGDAGTSPWGQVRVRLFVDGASRGDDYAANIAPGTTASFDFYWTATLGSHTVRAVADYGDAIPESNETNNERQEYLYVASGDVGPLTYEDHTIDDDESGQSSGDGDGIVDCGETVELYVTLRNEGNDAATGVSAAISTADPYVHFTCNTSSGYPDIPGGGTGTNSNDFDFEVDPGTPDGHAIHFDLNVSASNGGPWADAFDVPVTCAQAEWTFMVYLDGDNGGPNSLEGAAIDDFLEMSSVGSGSDVNVVLQFDRIPGCDDTYGDWTDTRRFTVTQGMEPWGTSGTSIGEANMGDPQTLVDFAQWGMGNFPAERYALVIWDHGSGWRGRTDTPRPYRDVAVDDTSGGDALSMPELRSALDALSDSGAEPIDLVGFDACLMGMIEVDDQLVPYADVRVGSEETEPADGWPYDTVLATLRTTPTIHAGQLGTMIVDAYHASYGDSEVLSAVDLGAPHAGLKSAVDAFAVALMDGLAGHYGEIAAARGSTQAFYYPTYVDLYDFAHQVNQRVSDATIEAAATDVMDAVSSAVIHEQHGPWWPGAHGISIYFPESESAYDGKYDGDAGWLTFTAGTRWDEWLHAFYAGVVCNDPYEPNDTPAGATPITHGVTLTGTDICPAGDVDYYAFTGQAGEAIVADIDAQAIGSALDADLYLYDTDGTTELAHNDDHDGLDSYIATVLPADGTYCLQVRDFNHPGAGGAGFFYTLSLAAGDAFAIASAWTKSAPSVDGQIAPGEWDSAATYDITGALAETRFFPQNLVSWPTGARERLTTVTLYAMNDGSRLYLAIDNPNDTSKDDLDQMGVYFDDDPLPSDGAWTHTSCGHADGEGNFLVGANGVDYREWTAGPAACDVVSPAPGTSGAVGHDSGHVQAEIAIDLSASALRAGPGDAVGLYLWILDHSTLHHDGQWPITGDFDDPATYGHLTLACDPLPAAPTLSAPADGESAGDNPPTFRWSHVSSATAYRIRVAGNASFDPPEIDAVTPETSYTPAGALLEGARYYWRVRGCNTCGEGAWSGAWTFTIPSAEPSGDTIYLPLVMRLYR